MQVPDIYYSSRSEQDGLNTYFHEKDFPEWRRFRSTDAAQVPSTSVCSPEARALTHPDTWFPCIRHTILGTWGPWGSSCLTTMFKKNMGQGHSREPQLAFIPIHTPMLVKLEGNNHPEIDRIRIYDTYFILDIPGWIPKTRQRHHIMMLSRRNHPIAPTTSGLHRCSFPLVGRWKKSKMVPPDSTISIGKLLYQTGPSIIPQRALLANIGQLNINQLLRTGWRP